MVKISVILVDSKFSGNVGAVARVMKNFGCNSLILVSPSCKIDVEAKNRAKHAQDILDSAIVLNSFEELRNMFDTLIGTTGIIGSDYNVLRSPVLLNDLKEKILGYDGSLGLVFGREDDGLYQSELSICDFSLHIPSSPVYPVLNLSHAVAVTLYEIFSVERGINLLEEHKALSFEEKNVLLREVDRIIDKTFFCTEDERENQRSIWKKFVGKAMLTKREGFALIGFLKKL
ncbi:RNA methyltransferase [Candidatus Woesearchaeota archaeon]|nr:RNA methyltransferase [Candidatus Woesearchaeota archaeon]